MVTKQQNKKQEQKQSKQELPGCDGDQFVTLWCTNCWSKITHPVSCGLRTCPHCRRRSFFRLRKKYLHKVAQVPVKKLALVTVTLRIKSGVSLKSLMQRIREAWSKLRRRLPWTKTVAGGFYSVEAKWSEKHQGWNCHLHSLVEAQGVRKPWKATCSYCAGSGCRKCQGTGWYWQADLLGQGVKLTPQGLDAIWKQITGDSYITNIMPVMKDRGGKQGALSYILKYLMKRAQVGQRAGEYNEAYHGRRVVHSFGTWHHQHKDCRWEEEPEEEPAPCPECGQVAGWMSEFELERLRRLAHITRAPPDDEPEPLSPYIQLEIA